mgnify:CR=1 FL=1
MTNIINISFEQQLAKKQLNKEFRPVQYGLVLHGVETAGAVHNLASNLQHLQPTFEDPVLDTVQVGSVGPVPLGPDVRVLQ